MEVSPAYTNDLLTLRAYLINRLKEPLPGATTQEQMAPQHRRQLEFSHDRTAAVLIAFMNGTEGVEFPLIRRVEDGLVHGGQIALPGGKVESGETFIQTALREAWEEVGLNVDEVEVIGELTTLEIPVSSFLVHPVVGMVNSASELTPCPREVAEIFKVSLHSLLDESNREYETRYFKQKEVHVPFFRFQGNKVWGATAMILSELIAVLNVSD